MIKSFACKETERFFTTGKSKRFPRAILSRAAKRLIQLHAATVINDLKKPLSNLIEALTGDRFGQWSIRINDQWRICFKFQNGNAMDVEIVDNH
jgi:toxin HigB-1